MIPQEVVSKRAKRSRFCAVSVCVQVAVVDCSHASLAESALDSLPCHETSQEQTNKEMRTGKLAMSMKLAELIFHLFSDNRDGVGNITK